MKWTLTQVIYCLVALRNFCHYYSSIPFEQAIILDWRICNWVDDYTSSLVWKVPSIPWTLAYRMRVLGRHQIDFSFFNELYMCLFQQQSLLIGFWRATNSLFNIWGCFMGPLECLWQSPWLDVTHAWHLKLHLVTIDEEMFKFDSVSCYLIISFRLPSICVHFRKLVLCKLLMNL